MEPGPAAQTYSRRRPSGSARRQGAGLVSPGRSTPIGSVEPQIVEPGGHRRIAATVSDQADPWARVGREGPHRAPGPAPAVAADAGPVKMLTGGVAGVGQSQPDGGRRGADDGTAEDGFWARLRGVQLLRSSRPNSVCRVFQIATEDSRAKSSSFSYAISPACWKLRTVASPRSSVSLVSAIQRAARGVAQQHAGVVAGTDQVGVLHRPGQAARPPRRPRGRGAPRTSPTTAAVELLGDQQPAGLRRGDLIAGPRWPTCGSRRCRAGVPAAKPDRGARPAVRAAGAAPRRTGRSGRSRSAEPAHRDRSARRSTSARSSRPAAAESASRQVRPPRFATRTSRSRPGSTVTATPRRTSPSLSVVGRRLERSSRTRTRRLSTSARVRAVP